MFFARSHPPAVREERLQSLWLAVNTPELAADELPAGPARGAIAVYEPDEPDECGALALCVLVRSLGDGALACWSWDGPLEAAALRRAIEAALCFAEGMGFLFDDDALASADAGSRRQALDLWWELSGWSEHVAEVRPDAEDTEAVASLVTPLPAVAATAETAPAPSAPRTRLPVRLPLTKFRRRLGAPQPEPPAERSAGSALGRLRLVKRARSGGTPDRPPLWLRLLGSF